MSLTEHLIPEVIVNVDEGPGLSGLRVAINEEEVFC